MSPRKDENPRNAGVLAALRAMFEARDSKAEKRAAEKARQAFRVWQQRQQDDER